MKKIISVIVSIIVLISSASFVFANDYIKGDVNSDKKVNTNDALIILNHIVKNKTAALNKNVADVNNDGKIDSKDVLYILQISVGKVTTTKQTTTTTTKKAVTTTKATTTTTKKATTTTTKATTTTTKAPATTAKPTTTTKKVTTTTAAAILACNVKTISTIKAPSSIQLDKNNVPKSYKKKLTGTASAYSGGGLTATGNYCKPGFVAVNPKQIPYHTKMWIVSNDGKYVYGYSSAEDTGGFIYWTGSSATLCDLYFPTESQCNNFGRRGVTIYIF